MSHRRPFPSLLPKNIGDGLRRRAASLRLRAKDLFFALADLLPRAAPAGGRPRVLYLEDRVPHPHLGQGYPRSMEMVRGLAEMGCRVTLFPVLFPEAEAAAGPVPGLPAGVEVVTGGPPLRRFLKERRGEYDLVMVSRPHNMETYKRSAPLGRRPRLVYDAEALFCMREIEQRRAEGRPYSPRWQRRLIAAEVALAAGSRCVVSVSQGEGRRFSEFGVARVFTLPHTVEARPTPAPHGSRAGFLFVGPVQSLTTPNGSGVAWFAREVLPLLRERLGPEVSFRVAGWHDPEAAAALAGAGVEFLGKVDDLTGVYDAARVFVAPSRFAAGVPLKIYEAAARGLPVVATPLLAAQLGWRDGEELAVGGDAASFADRCAELYGDAAAWERLRARALEAVRAECAPELFAGRLRQIVAAALED